MIGQIIKCAKCGLETKVDIENSNVRSFLEPTPNMKLKCEAQPFRFTCLNFQEAIISTIPFGLRRKGI
jgi:hypothetical protein